MVSFRGFYYIPTVWKCTSPLWWAQLSDTCSGIELLQAELFILRNQNFTLFLKHGELLVCSAMLFLIPIESQLKPLDLLFLLFAELIQGKRLVAEPVAFLLELAGTGLLLLDVSLHVGFLLELLHIVLDNVHFLFESWHEILFVLLDNLLNVDSLGLYTNGVILNKNLHQYACA